MRKVSATIILATRSTQKTVLYSNLRVEEVKGFRYISHTVISCNPEGNALDHVFKIAAEHGIKNPKVIGRDFPHLSVEQINVYNMQLFILKAPLTILL